MPFESHRWYFLEESNSNTLIRNSCNSNDWYGINIDDTSEGNIHHDNTCNDNGVGEFYPISDSKDESVPLWVLITLIILVLLLIFIICLTIYMIRMKYSKTKNSMFMEVCTDLSLSELEEFLLANYPNYKFIERKNRIYVGGKFTAIFPLLIIYDYGKHRIATQWVKRQDSIKYSFISILLILLVIPAIVGVIWILMKRNEIMKILVSIKEEDTRLKESEP